MLNMLLPMEIERKFLLANDSWRFAVTKSKWTVQGYLATNPWVRVRTSENKGFLTIKEEKKVESIARFEFEYEIPFDDAAKMLRMCPSIITKERHIVPASGSLIWEIDEFSGDNTGLIVAEIELTSKDQPFEKPSWLGEEVTADLRYYNPNLSTTPFSTWNNK
jgi:adenylate cyclase